MSSKRLGAGGGFPFLSENIGQPELRRTGKLCLNDFDQLLFECLIHFAFHYMEFHCHTVKTAPIGVLQFFVHGDDFIRGFLALEIAFSQRYRSS
jgi:hypothetical protein